MALKLKNKIALGGVFLFLLLFLVAAISIFYFNRQITNSKDILKDNYESIEYGKNMLQALNSWNRDTVAARRMFEENLARQEGNITEPGEQDITADIRQSYRLFQM